MKLIIEIPEDSYERVMNPDKFYRDIDAEKIRWAVYKGTPIPDNATVCDIDAIRAEISDMFKHETQDDYWDGYDSCRVDVLQIIDKYTK